MRVAVIQEERLVFVFKKSLPEAVVKMSPFVIVFITTVIIQCVKSDPCISYPCQNNGVCTSYDGVSFICKCTEQYFGKRCEVLNEACSKSNRCVHGSCREDVYGDYHCDCDNGYYGKYCELDYDDCSSSPCRNSALCIDKVDDYECVCQIPGTFGKLCELRQEDIEVCRNECQPSSSICWRNYTITIDVPWGYGDNICNTQHTCFGGENNTVVEHHDYFIDVQLHPVQMQLGDLLNFTTDNSIFDAINGLILPQLLPVDVYNSTNSFVNCNTSNGIQLVNSAQYNVVINSSELLYVGFHYFIMNIDFIYRCDFGLRLNVSVKDHDCRDKNDSMATGLLCSGRGQCHTNFSLAQYQCKCCAGFHGRYCEKRDYCYVNPCKNDGMCQNVENGKENYTCLCQRGYKGKHCSIIVDMCRSHPCRNGALCTSSVNAYHCQCSPGYYGDKCEYETNECLSGPCQNNATCIDKIAGFLCSCPSGFNGTYCEVDIDECESKPCQHGVCSDKINGFECSCYPGFIGVKCNITMKNTCLSTPCMHNGVCVEKKSGYVCNCGIGYQGKNCEIDINLCNQPEICRNFKSCTDRGNYVTCVCKPGYTGSNCGVNINDCVSQPCRFGGKCVDLVDNFHCLCASGYEGKTCGQVNETVHDPQRLHLRIVTDDCYKLQDQMLILDTFQRNVAESIHMSCDCPFSQNDIVNGSVGLYCHNKTTGSLYMRITDVEPYVTEQLICVHQRALKNDGNSAILDNDTRVVEVVYNKERCNHVIELLRNNGDDNSDAGTIALTVGLVLALLGLFTAAFIVFLKWRKKAKPIKQQTRIPVEQTDSLTLDLLSAVAPTPRSLYSRTNKTAARRNYGFTSPDFDPIQTSC